MPPPPQCAAYGSRAVWGTRRPPEKWFVTRDYFNWGPFHNYWSQTSLLFQQESVVCTWCSRCTKTRWARCVAPTTACRFGLWSDSRRRSRRLPSRSRSGTRLLTWTCSSVTWRANAHSSSSASTTTAPRRTFTGRGACFSSSSSKYAYLIIIIGSLVPDPLFTTHRFWTRVATEFRHFDNLLGYDLLNEPWAGDVYTNPLKFLPGVLQAIIYWLICLQYSVR